MNVFQTHLGRHVAVALLSSAVSAAALGAGIPVPSGQLVLDLGSSNQWRYGDERQSLTTASGNRCDLLPYPQSGPDQLVSLSGSSPGVGFLAKRGKELIGIVGPGVDCGRVNAGEYLEIALTGPSLGDKMFLGVNLALNVKGNAVMRGIAYDDGAGTSQTFMLYSGRSIPPTLNPATEASCAPGSDSDPDDDATNCHWPIPGSGNRLRLEVVTGEAGIGGAGSTSVFEIGRVVPATGIINCGDSTISAQYLNTDEGDDATVQCYRKDNLDGSSCEAVDYSLVATCENGQCQTTFIHALEDDDPTNNTKFEFICETWWPTQSAQFLAGSFELPKSEQFFGPDELQGADLDFCEGVTPVFDGPACTFGSGGEVAGCTLADIETVQVPLTLDHQGAVPGQQVGCLLDERVRQIEDLEKSVVDSLFKHYQMWVLKGDYRVSRAF